MFKNSYRSVLLAGVMLAAGPAVANATTTPTPAPAGARAVQTISRFYSQADRVSPRQGFIRFMGQRATLRPFFKTFEHQSNTGTLGDGGFARVDAAVSEGVLSYAQRPLIKQEESTAKQLQRIASGGARQNASLLATYFADQLQAGTTLSQYPKWQSHRFVGNMPEAIQTLNHFARSHHAFLAKNVTGKDLFRSAEPTLPRQQRTMLDLQARLLTQNTDSLALVLDAVTRAWEGLPPGRGFGVPILP